MEESASGAASHDAAPQAESGLSWYDVHCHLQDERLKPFAPVWREMRRAGVRMAVSNGTCEEDWGAVESLATKHPGEILPAWGIHPWYADRALSGWEKRLERLLIAHPFGQIGECGLDGSRGRPPMPLQIGVFREHLRLAKVMRRPLTIHCVKAWPTLWHVFRREAPPAAFLLHSYQGSLENAMRLAEIGGWFSFSPALLDPRRREGAARFRLLPPDRVLLETDAPNHPANLAATGKALAAWLEWDEADLAERLRQNSLAFWQTG